MAGDVTRALGYARSAGLFAWVVGLFTFEALATGGAALCAAAVVAQLALERRWPSRADLRAGWPLYGFVTSAVVMPLLFGHWPTGTGFARLLEWLLLPVASWAVAASSPRVRRALVITAAVTFGLSAVTAGLQHFGVWPPFDTFAPLAWTRIPFARVYEPAPDAEGRFLAGGLAFHRLKFAHVGALAVGWLVGVAQAQRGRARVALNAVAAAGAVAVLLFPAARAAVAALPVGVAVALIASPGWTRQRLAVAGGVMLLAAAAALAYGPVRARLVMSTTAEGSGGRSALVGAGWAAVKSAPLGGVGLGRFWVKDYAAGDAPEFVREQRAKAHFQVITIAAEGGVLTAAWFVVLIAWLALSLWRRRAAAGLGALAAFLVLCLVHDPLTHPQVSVALMLSVGAALKNGDRLL